MKKTLVAIAALAAFGAQAQSTVVLDGNLDISYAIVGASAEVKDASYAQRTGSTIVATQGASTSTINITATDDMGGGLKGLARFEIDPRAFLVDGTALAAHQRYVGVSGGFGTVKLGAVDSAALATAGAASPLGTATGSGYGVLHSTVVAATRYNRSAKFESAVYNGLSGSVLYAPGINPAYVASPSATTVGSTEYAGLPFQRAVTELGLAYANGPLNVNFANVSAASSNDAQTAAAATSAAPQVTTVAIEKTSTNILGANYTMGNATVYVGWNKGKTLGASQLSSSGVYAAPAVAAGLDTNGSRLGFKYVMGSTNFILSTAKQTIHDSASAEHTRKVNGFRATRDLSKQTSIYFAYEQYNTGATFSNTTADGGKYTVTAVGIRRQF